MVLTIFASLEEIIVVVFVLSVIGYGVCGCVSGGELRELVLIGVHEDKIED